MTLLWLIAVGLALAVPQSDRASAGGADRQATLSQVAKMEAPQRQRWLLELELRLDVAGRKVLTAEQASQERERVFKLLRQKIVSRQDLSELLLLAEQRERAARTLASRVDPLDVLRRSIVKQAPRPPLPPPTPSIVSDRPGRRPTSIGPMTKSDAGPRGASHPSTFPTLGVRRAVERLAGPTGDVNNIITRTLVRRTVDTTVGSERPAKHIGEIVEPSSPRVASGSDIGQRPPGGTFVPRRPAETSAGSQTDRASVPARDLATRRLHGGASNTPETTNGGKPIARTTLKPPLPSGDSQADLPPRSAVTFVNMSELSTRVAGNNLAFRSLEAELDERGDSSAEQLGSLVDRLGKLVTRRNDIALYMGVLSSRDRIRAGRLESPQTVVLQLESHIDAARARVAGPQFGLGESERQAELRHLDELSRALGRL